MKDGKIDYYSLDKIIEFQISEGISALTVAGTTGENACLSYREHKQLIRHAVNRVNGRIPVIAGTGSNDTEKAVKMSYYACEYGADALLVVTPYYNKANKEGLISHYEKISEASSKPIIIYNVPGRTCINITPEMYEKLKKIKNIGGIKEASTNLSDIAMTNIKCPEIPLYCGNDDLLIPALACGASGIISVMSNIFPGITSAICRHYLEGDKESAVALYKKYLHFSRLLFSDVNPIPIKHIMSYAGFCRDEIRLPLVKASDELKEKLETEYEKLTK
jgi:4-hydroxy-tetrahydrodipicolinate synthase